MNKKILIGLCLAAVALGIYFRLTNIAQNQLFYYDEGFYLSMHRAFDELIERTPPRNLLEGLKYLKYNLYLSLGSGKTLWLFLIHLRGFFGFQFEDFYFTRILAALFGIVTLGMTYLFALRYFKSQAVALLSLVILALLPSHVYYSRLGMQETLSALCLLTGFYFYLIPNKFGPRSILGSIFFVLSYLSNYRMFLIPVHVFLAEVYLAVNEKVKFNVRRFLWSMVAFAAIIVFFGCLNDGSHFRFNFIWMLRQSESAQGHFSFLSLLSYPYGIFRLESLVLGAFLFMNVLFIKRDGGEKMLPFVLALLQMAIFSFAHERGYRYLCVILPFLAMAVAYAIYRCWSLVSAQKYLKTALIILVGLMLAEETVRANTIRHFSSAYQASIQDIRKGDPDAKIITSQPLVQSLFSPNADNVKELPDKFESILAYSSHGYHYMILDPQAYISFTESGERFDPPLKGPLEFAASNLQPVKEYDHFSDAMLERFVLEHNVNLSDSLKFLKANKEKHFNKLRVYRTKDFVEEVLRRLEYRNQHKSQPPG